MCSLEIAKELAACNTIANCGRSPLPWKCEGKMFSFSWETTFGNRLLAVIRLTWQPYSPPSFSALCIRPPNTSGRDGAGPTGGSAQFRMFCCSSSR